MLSKRAGTPHFGSYSHGHVQALKRISFPAYLHSSVMACPIRIAGNLFIRLGKRTKCPAASCTGHSQQTPQHNGSLNHPPYATPIFPSRGASETFATQTDILTGKTPPASRNRVRVLHCGREGDRGRIGRKG